MAGFDFGSGASGATSGAMIGSAIPGVGTAIGAGVGGLVGGLFGGKKKRKKPKPMSTLDANQQRLYGDLNKSIRGNGPFSDLYKYDAEAANANFDANVSRPAYRNFQENIIPGITGQYRQNNLMQSSYSGEALGRAGRNVQEGLDAQRSNMAYQGTQDAANRKQNAINSIMGMQTQAYQKPGPQNPSGIDQILNSLGPASGEWLADYMKNKPAAPIASGSIYT